MKKILLSVGVISLISSAMVYGATNNEKLSQTLEEFKLAPQMTVWGLTGTNTSEEAQVMLPLWGDAKKLLYTIADGLMVDNQSRWTGSFGAGYRQVFDDDHILGAYVLGEYTNTDSNRGFWAINPGVERLGELWDFRINGHVLFGSKKWLYEGGWESDRGVDSYVYQTGHDFYDNKYKEGLSTGTGEDFEIGRKFPILKNLKLFVGAYHYDIADNSTINGISARAEFPINNNFALDLRTTYDNFKRGVILGGIKVSLGGFSSEQKARFGISGRLMDPIVHNIATNYAGLPAKYNYVVQGTRLLKYDHVWYFKSDASQPTGSGDGTYEHPFNEPNIVAGHDAIQDKITYIQGDPMGGSYAHLFFAGWGGTYDLNNAGVTTITLPGSYDIMGRMDSYKLAATGNQRPIFYNGLLELDTGNNVLDSFKLIDDNVPYHPYDPSNWPIGAITINNANNITINNVVVGDPSTQNQYSAGIYLYNSTNVTLDSSEIYAYCSNDVGNCSGPPTEWWGVGAAAIYTDSTSQLTILNNNIISGNSYNSDFAGGIFSMGQLNIIGNNNQIGANSSSEADGIYILGGVTISGNDNNIAANAHSGTGDTIASGIRLDGGTPSLTITGQNNIISGNATSTGGEGDGYGIMSHDSGAGFDVKSTIIISGLGNTISADGSSKAIGIYSADDPLDVGSIINVSGVTFNIAQNSNPTTAVYGIQIDQSFNPSNLVVTGNTFNIGGNISTRYGIYNSTGTDFSSDQYNSLINNNTFNGVSGNNRVSPQPLLTASSAAVASVAPQQQLLASESSNVDGNTRPQPFASKVIIKLKTV